MFISRNLRILTNLTKNTLIHRNLRGLPRRNEEFKSLPVGINTPHKELANLKGEPTAEQLRSQETTDEIQPANEATKGGLLPTYNLAAYVNKSTLLQQFIKLGVDLSAIEKRKGLPQFVLRLQLDQDVNPRLLFLKDHGVPSERFGEFITKNPLIFKVDLDDLQTRVNYMESKRFSSTQIQRILTLNPYWLMFSTKRIDKRLGYFQREFFLSGDDVRSLASQLPRLITYNMEHIREATFSIREEMGFSKHELKRLLLSKPRLWILNTDNLVERFAYAHQQMKLSHKMIIDQPNVLTAREFQLRERHEFLEMLGRAQYDPEKDMYVSPNAVVEGNNYDFVRNVAKCDMETFELFLRTR